MSHAVLANTDLPVIHRIGVIPTSWQGEDSFGIENLKKHAETISHDLIIESKRFDVLNKDLVDELWSTPEGRRELTSEFELDSFIHFTVYPKEDHITVLARLLDANLEIQLQETETLERLSAVNRSYDQLKELFRPLTFRLLTRLPIDVSVTSVQGSYITVSGGEDQALSVGDKLDIVRASVKSVHPAHGGWNEFKTVRVGSATIIETKKSVSVAKITSQIKEGAIKIADGATVEGLGTRRLFAKDTTVAELSIEDTKQILVPPSILKGKTKFPAETVTLDKDGKPVSTKKVSDAPDKLEDSELSEADAELAEIEEAQGPGTPVSPQIPVSTGSDYGDSYTEDSSIFGSMGVKNIAESVDVTPRYRSWTFTGPITTGSNFSIIPANEIGATLNQSLNSNIKYQLSAFVGYGKTDLSTSFFSHGAEAKAYFKDLLPVRIPLFQAFKAGAKGTYDGRSVSAGQYGGHNIMLIGFFSGLTGEERIAGERLNINAEFSMTPLAFGQIGYNGSYANPQQTNGYDLSLSAVTIAGRKQISYGASYTYATQKYTNSGTEQVATNEHTFEGIARWRF